MSHNSRWLLGLAFLAMVLPAEAGYGITIEFHSQAAVAQPFILLGDIAKITNADPEILFAYQNAKIAPAPPAGGQRLLDFDTIRTRMIALGLSTGELQFTGASRVLVENPGTAGVSLADQPNFPAADPESSLAKRIAQQAIRSALSAGLEPGELARAEVLLEIPPQFARYFHGTSASDWRITGWSEELEQTHQLLFTRQQESAPVSAIPVRCAIKMPPRVLSVNKILPAGHVVTRSDLDWVYSSEPGGQTEIEKFLGMETANTLRPGRPIQPDDLRKKPYVRTRDLVSVFARQGGITVKQTMRALGTGGLGEIVTFVNLDGKERLTARVTGYHEAEVVDATPQP